MAAGAGRRALRARRLPMVGGVEHYLRAARLWGVTLGKHAAETSKDHVELTHSPVGARLTVGSCAKTGATTSFRVKACGALGVSATAWTTCELVIQALIPTPSVISAAHMWYLPSSARCTEPPQLLTCQLILG